jgi:integrase
LAFGRWLDQEESSIDVEHLSGRHLERFQDWRAERVKPKTQQLSASAIRGLLRWAAIQEPPLLSATLWLRVTMPRIGRAMPRPIPPADLARILSALAPLPPSSDLIGRRTRALFLLILSSGARISEAVSLDRGQLQDRQAVVIQKGGSEKLLVISEAAEQAIADYLAARTDSCRALFVTHDENPTARLGLGGTHGRGQNDWTRLSKQLGIARFTAHQIRHTTATELLRQGVDSLVIARHLGHRGLQSIAGYAEVGLDTRHQMLELFDSRLQSAPPAQPVARPPIDRLIDLESDEPLSLADVWLQVRVNFDLGHVTRGEMETFARLTGRDDLIAEAKLTCQEFAALVISEGGLYPFAPTLQPT